MANKNIFFFYLLKIFDVSKMTILKCPSWTNLATTSKLTFFRETLDTWLKYRVFLCVNDTMMSYLVYKMGNNQVKLNIFSNFSQGYFCSKLDTDRCSMMDIPSY